MERLSFIEHKGKKILYADYRDLCGADAREEIAALVKAEMELIAKQPKKSLLTLTDVTNIHVCKEVNELLTQMTAHNKPYVKKAAVLGVTGVKAAFYNIMMALSDRKIKIFDDIEEARDWLVSDKK
jgi:hypothetical protein